MLDILPNILILFGAFALLFSLSKANTIIMLLKEKHKRKPWHLLRTLMGGFSIGYIVAIAILYYTNNGLLFEGSFVLVFLMGIIFFFGALFVFLVVRVSLKTISDLTDSYIMISKQNKEKEKNEKIKVLINKRLEKKNNELESFNLRISEDLSTPLNAIYNLSNTLINKDEKSDLLTEKMKQETFMKMNELAEYTQIFISDLLAYTSMNLNEEFQNIDTNETLNQILEELKSQIVTENAEIKKNTLPNLNIPPLLFHQVLYQLILNALQYGHVDRTPSIEILYQVHKDFYMFQVSDNGKGISSIFLEDIFLLFKKGEQSINNRSSGIGLTLCRKVVESWGGTIEVESIPQKGSIFSFSVPKRE